MHKLPIIFLGLLAACFAGSALASLVVDVDDDPVADACPTHCSLRQAIQHAPPNDSITFDPKVRSTILLSVQSETNSPQLVIDKNLSIGGPGAGRLTVSAQNHGRVLVATYDAIVEIKNITLADGQVVGDAGGPGGQDANGNGIAGGAGQDVIGGCVVVEGAATLTLADATVRHCLAQGGPGGQGGKGRDGSCLVQGVSGCTTSISAGSGGAGGVGGKVSGGAIYVDPDSALILTSSSVIDALGIGGTGGTGGAGGAGARGVPAGLPGAGGPGGAVTGGAIHAAPIFNLVYNWYAADVTNSTVGASAAVGGDGGNAATSPSTGVAGQGGNARGGLLYGVGASHLAFSTLAGGHVEAGAKGALGSGGSAGVAYESALDVVAADVSSTVIMGAEPGIDLCSIGMLNVENGSNNLIEDASCSGFNLHASLAQTLRPLATTAPLPGYIPAWHGAAMDSAASCSDTFDDQNLTPRPQGAQCDLGSIEADYVFVGSFEQQ